MAIVAVSVSAETAFGWNRWPNMAPQAAAALLLLGAATFAYALAGSLRASGRTPGWLAPAAGLTLLSLCTALALALEANQSLVLWRDTAASSRGVRTALQRNVENSLRVVERMVGEWSARGPDPEDGFLPATRARVRDYPVYRAILWEDSSERVRSVVSPLADGRIWAREQGTMPGSRPPSLPLDARGACSFPAAHPSFRGAPRCWRLRRSAARAGSMAS
ncbi:MAG: hypothetical protein HY423_02125 [Candidatus Lambdaproteobacteria bacterium]|nr:hypothetical protein [Candidatus Lambdaproteobacteria bacterium]